MKTLWCLAFHFALVVSATSQFTAFVCALGVIAGPRPFDAAGLCVLFVGMHYVAIAIAKDAFQRQHGRPIR